MYRDGRRMEPYKNYKFVVKMDGKPIPGITKVSPLKRATEVITWNEAGRNDRDLKTPGRTSYGEFIMERGLTDDRVFEEWALLVAPVEDTSRGLVEFKKDLQLEIRDEENRSILLFNLYGCWVSEYIIPEFDASADEIAIERITVQVDAWERVDF
ncbi:MAG: phage tail protein [Candidatus Hodarchaeota archaeon]